MQTNRTYETDRVELGSRVTIDLSRLELVQMPMNNWKWDVWDIVVKRPWLDEMDKRYNARQTGI